MDSKMMNYIEVVNQGASLNYRSVSRPSPQDNEVLIKVFAAGVNRADLLQRKGGYPPPAGASEVLGLEVSGEIIALGAGVTTLKVGQQVCALLPGGGYAQYCVADAGSCLPIPSGFDFTAAAALPEAAFTAWTMIWELGQLAQGQSLLIHGGSSCIGTLAAQMAVALGHPVYVTAGSDEKCQACLQLGIEAAINYNKEDFVEKIRHLTQGKGVDVVLDMVGGDYVQRNLDSMSIGGRLVLIAFLGGRVANFDIRKLMHRRQQILGATLRSRSLQYKSYLAQQLQQNIWPHLDANTIRPVIDEVYPLADAERAHQRVQSGIGLGKVILAVDHP